MRNKLFISKPIIVIDNDKARMQADVVLKGVSTPIYYEVDKKFSRYFSNEVSDAYLICLLLYSMEHDLDLEFEGGISETLYYQVTQFLMPAITKNIHEYKKIDIKCESLLNINFEPQITATGISCGVDSFYTILKNLNHSKESGLNLDYLVTFNAGSHGDNGGDSARALFNERCELFKKVSAELNCEFMSVDSNMNEFLQQDHEQTHVFRTLSIPLAMQKMFKIYYFSSGVEYQSFSFQYYDPAFYDILSMPLLSTNNIKFITIGGECSRQEKIKYISQFDIVKKYLNVCIMTSNNCCKCSKCFRTMLNLYIEGKIDEFGDVFDLEYFYKNKRVIIRWALINKNSLDIDKIVFNLKKKKEIKFSDYCYILFFKPYRFIRRLFTKRKR